jgi:hypothetical protein
MTDQAGQVGSVSYVALIASVRWGRIIGMALVLACLYHLTLKGKPSDGLRGLFDVILWGIASIVLLVLIPSVSSAEIEIVAAISLGLVIEALFSLLWSRRAARKSGAKGLSENGPHSPTAP